MPPLTTLASDPRGRGRQAAALALAGAQHPPAQTVRTVAPVELVVRQSSGPAPR
jgi:LacI family transcriptional regulator